MPELRQLRTFVVVAEELNFTRAAERLHLGQQAVSKSVGQLERELAVELLERTTREVRLTPAGAALLESGREVLRVADAAFEQARTVARGLSGTVRVGHSPAIGPVDRADVVRTLRANAPDLSVSLHEVRPADVLPALRQGDVDVVLLRASGAADDRLDSTALRPTPMVLCVPAAHRLASAESARLADLDGERLLIWSPPGTPYTDLLIANVAASGANVTPVETRITGGALSLEQLHELGAIALMPAGTTPPPDIALVELHDDITMPLVLVWLAGRPPWVVERLRAGMTAPG